MGLSQSIVRLNEESFGFISETLNLKKSQIKSLAQRYFGKEFDRQLSKDKFVEFYCALVINIRASEIAKFIFTAFDENQDHLVSWGEFVVSLKILIQLFQSRKTN